MKQLYSSIGLVGLVVVLSTLANSLRISFDTFLNLDPPAHVLHIKLLTCDRTCRCTDACAHMNYTDQGLHCELVRRNRGDRSLHFDRRIGFINTEHNGRLLSDGALVPDGALVSDDSGRDCVSSDFQICPDLDTDGDTVLLHNLTTVGRQNLAQFTWPAGQDGWNTTSCTTYSPCSDYDTRITQSTMRWPCQVDSECVDAESECRDGLCWCKPGLSHDLDSLACVNPCPEQNGSTFQEVNDVFFGWFRVYEGDSVAYDVRTCKDRCLSYNNYTGYVCKYAHYYRGATPGWCSIKLFPDIQAMRLTVKLGINSTVLVRDCKSRND